MVNKKHQKHMNEIFLYIYNRIAIGIDVLTVRDEVIRKFSPELAFYDVTPEMCENLVEELCLQAYFYINKRVFGEEDCN